MPKKRRSVEGCVCAGVDGKLKCADITCVGDNEISIRLEENFYQDKNKFVTGKKYIFILMKIFFYTVRNLFLTGKKFIANLIEIYRDAQRNKNASKNVFAVNVAFLDVLRRHNKVVLAGLTRNPLPMQKTKGLRVKPARTASIVVVYGIKPAMTTSVVVVCGINPAMTASMVTVCEKQPARTLSIVATKKHNPSFSFYHYYNVAMDNDASILVSSTYRFFGGELLDNHSFNLNQTERYLYEV